MPVRLTWTDVAADDVEQRVYRSTSPIDPGNLPAPLAVISANDTEYIDDALEEVDAYHYRVSTVRRLLGEEVAPSLEIVIDLANRVASEISPATGWQTVSGGSVLDPGFTDPEGGTGAVQLTLIGTSDHHAWYDLAENLTPGQAYTAWLWLKAGAAGFSDTCQIAYYDDGNSVNGTEVTVTGEWVRHAFTFTAGDAPLNDPSLRLVGWGNGADGDTIQLWGVQLRPGTWT